MSIRVKTRRRGMVMVFVILMLVVLAGFCSLAVDYGRVQTAKTELQRTADAAARAAVASISNGISSAQSAATNVAAANQADGAAVTLASTDIEFGTWNSSSHSFTVLSGSARSNANAIRVTARKADIPLYFASAIGMSSIDVDATAIAQIGSSSTTSVIGFVALSGMEFKKEAFIGSYNSSNTTNPTQGTSTGNALLSSNGEIDFKKESTLDGDVHLGPDASLDDSELDMSGDVTDLDDDISAPADPSWSPSTNPGGIAQNYTVSSSTTLAGGTYWFTSLKINKPLTFSGSATLYVNGNIEIDDSVSTYQSLPANLKIYQLGSDRKFDVKKEATLTAQVYAPGSKFTAKKEFTMRGSLIVDTLTTDKALTMFSDDNSTSSTTSSSGGGAICIVE